MKIIGITGGVGAGKSEILNYIKQHYLCEIYLADQVAHAVEKKGTECYFQLVELLGNDVLAADGEIDKKEMANKIFLTQGMLEKVNDLVHPAVKEYLLARIQEAREKQEVELFFIEAALLIECGYHSVVDEMWYIYAKEEVRLKRLMENRGYSLEKSKAIMNKQLSHDLFLKNSDFKIDNSGELSESYKQIDKKLEDFSWHS